MLKQDILAYSSLHLIFNGQATIFFILKVWFAYISSTFIKYIYSAKLYVLSGLIKTSCEKSMLNVDKHVTVPYRVFSHLLSGFREPVIHYSSTRYFIKRSFTNAAWGPNYLLNSTMSQYNLVGTSSQYKPSNNSWPVKRFSLQANLSVNLWIFSFNHKQKP